MSNAVARRAASSPTYYHQPASRPGRVAARRTGMSVRRFFGLVGLALVFVLSAGLMLNLFTT